MHEVRPDAGTQTHGSPHGAARAGRPGAVTLVARRAASRPGVSACRIVIKAAVLLATRTLGPGPRRLRMVKLVHRLGGAPEPVAVEAHARSRQDLHAPPVQPARRAA